MKEIRLQDLTLINFKGMNFKLIAVGANTDVYGANATGKTTLADAFSWLLFDKDSLGRSGFEIKNIDAQGEAEHGLEHSVEVVILVDGATITLKKTYHEVWTKKRGSAKAEYTGNTTDYWIDGVPVQKKEYVATIAEIVGEESIFRLLTTPTAFPALHWKDGRAILMKVCGDVSDADVIASDPALAPLTDILGHRTLDDHKKVVTARRTEINKQLPTIPVRIDEVKKGLPDVTGLNQKQLLEKIEELDKEIGNAKLRLQGIDNGAGIAGLSKELQGLIHDISGLENNYYREGLKHVTDMNARINELQSGKDDAARRVKAFKDELTTKKDRLNFLEKTMETLRQKWEEVDRLEFKNTVEDTCPTCGQTLPTDRVMEAYDKALAAFNQDKASQLDCIQTEGKGYKTEAIQLTALIMDLNAKLMEIQAVGDDDQTAMLIAERDILKARAEDYSQIPGRAEKLERKATLEVLIEKARAGLTQDRTLVQKEIADLIAQMNDLKEKANRFSRIEQGEARIKDLKAQEKLLAAEFERLEKELFLIESFIKTKVSMLTEKINGLFQIARFKLFDVQVNGGIAECCEITVNGIPYNGGLNNAARINAGLDVCRTLSRHYGLVAPVFVDNAESVCELISMDAQVIRLVVSEKDAALRVETAQKRKAA
jgi:hypothetical protein